MAGDTPILTADGRTRPLADLRVGDRIYGTVRRGRERGLTTTRVVDHWSTTKPAYRVTLEDGARLVTSEDHRLLTNVGWKFVAPRPGSLLGRPHLRVGSKLVGTGRFAAPPKDTDDYRLGYLCGIFRCDAHPGPFVHPAGGRQRLRFVSGEYESLARAREYLLTVGVPTDRFLARPGGTTERREVLAVRSANGDGIELLGRLRRWPADPTDDWRKGFLAGCFDACGSHHDEIVIDNADAGIITNAVVALRQLAFDVVIEGAIRIRLRGGLAERLRFLHTVDPAVSRKRMVDWAVLGDDATLAVRSVEPLGVELPLFDITTETGDFIANGVVSHNCFARHSHSYLGRDSGANFDSQATPPPSGAPVPAVEQLTLLQWVPR